MARMRRTIKNHSGLPRDKLPPVPEVDLNLYHWSPSSNYNNINRMGLEIGKLSLQGDWRPPYVCFSDDPYLAWILSGHMWPSTISWDLWMCNMRTQTSFRHHELILDTFIDTGRHFIKEYRVYCRVFKRDLVYLATRKQ